MQDWIMNLKRFSPTQCTHGESEVTQEMSRPQSGIDGATLRPFTNCLKRLNALTVSVGKPINM